MLVSGVVAGAAWATCSWASAATGASAMRAPRPMATYLLIIAVPLEASLPTLVSQTISICASQAELEMNIGITGCAPIVGLRYYRRGIGSLDSGAKRNALKRSGFERPFQARQSRLGRAS